MTNLQSLISALLSGNDENAEATVQKIASLGTKALPALRDLLSSSDADVRWWATRTIAEIRDPKVLPLLQRSLKDPETVVRQCAALALKEQPAIEAIPDLITALGDDDRLLSRLAADALIATGSSALPHLIKVMENSTPAARIEAARTLALIQDEEAIPTLFKALDDDSMFVQHWAEEGLSRLGVGMMFFGP